MIVRSGTKVGPLGQDTMLPNHNFSDAINLNIIANPAIIADYHVPRKGNSNSRSNQNVSTNFCAKKP
jgi:hypothetical protein